MSYDRQYSRAWTHLHTSSHPNSEHYGKYYTAEEVHDIFAPSQAAVDTIRGWLESAGISKDRISQSVNKQWMQFEASVEEANNLLRTDFHLWEHTPSGKMNVACDE